jgi:hypothetical protein
MPEGGVAAGGDASGLAGLGDMRAATPTTLTNPGKWDELDGQSSQVLEFQTWDGVSIDYSKSASQSQTSQLMMQHGLKMGNARTEGYTLTSTYVGNSGALFMQGQTSSNLDLQVRLPP